MLDVSEKTLVIIGTGLAGYNLAREFRKLDSKTPLIMITQDKGAHYHKPHLSTALSLQRNPEMLVMSSLEKMQAELNAVIYSQVQVTKIDPTLKKIKAGEMVIPYQQLILACGAETLSVPFAGNAVDQVLTVNNLEEYAVFRSCIHPKKRVAIIGAGLVGCEFANDLTNSGHPVSVIALDQTPLRLLIPESIGEILKKSLEKNGVHWYLNECVARVNHHDDFLQLHLVSGKIIDTDVVVSAIGLRPKTEIASRAGIKINQGIVVNRYLETSVENIYALGDCAEVEGRVLCYVAPLLQCARALAHTLAGKKTAVSYPAMPISIKTPAYPVVVMAPPQNTPGDWEMDFYDHGVRALFYDTNKKLRGFILTGDQTKDRAELVTEISKANIF